MPCSASRVVPGAHRVVGPGTHRGSGPREVHTTRRQPERNTAALVFHRRVSCAQKTDQGSTFNHSILCRERARSSCRLFRPAWSSPPRVSHRHTHVSASMSLCTRCPLTHTRASTPALTPQPVTSSCFAPPPGYHSPPLSRIPAKVRAFPCQIRNPRCIPKLPESLLNSQSTF
jgi:hypothetical protein